MTHITGKENTNFRLEAVAAKADIEPLSSICESESEPTASVLQTVSQALADHRKQRVFQYLVATVSPVN